MGELPAQWYGLLPKHNEHHFDPTGILRESEEFSKQSAREIFNEFIGRVKSFHKKVVGKYHPQTYAFWASSRKNTAVGEALWDWSQNVIQAEGQEYQLDTPIPTDSGKGEYRHEKNLYTLHTVMHVGDGTVPRASWEGDLAKAGMQGYCCIGVHPKATEGFEHQQAFNSQPAREASFYFLAKLVSSNAGELQE